MYSKLKKHIGRKRTKQETICKNAENKIEEIICDITSDKKNKITNILGTTIKPLVHNFYKKIDHRKNFYVTDLCTGCGLCEKNCPCKAIVMKDHKPVWKDNCSFCLKCIHSCPVQALQYGKGTLNRSRYLNHMKHEQK